MEQYKSNITRDCKQNLRVLLHSDAQNSNYLLFLQEIVLKPFTYKR